MQTKMLKILRKYPIQIEGVSKSQEINQLKINPRFIRTILDFDGSMTKFVTNLVGGETKPSVKILEEQKIQLKDNIGVENSQQSKERQILFDLRRVFLKQMSSQTKVETSKINLVERSIQFYITNENLKSSPKLLYFARSFWNEQKYVQIMSKAKLKPIGLNLIQHEIEIFRKINWTGLVDLQISQIQQEKSSKIYKNLCSRSYSMISKGQPLCELEEFFLPEMFDIFQPQQFN